MAPASAKRRENNPPSKSGQRSEAELDPDRRRHRVLFLVLVTSQTNNLYFDPVEATVLHLFHYEILQFPFEEDDELFGGLWGGLKDLERFRLLPLLPPLLPEAALLATE